MYNILIAILLCFSFNLYSLQCSNPLTFSDGLSNPQSIFFEFFCSYNPLLTANEDGDAALTWFGCLDDKKAIYVSTKNACSDWSKPINLSDWQYEILDRNIAISPKGEITACWKSVVPNDPKVIGYGIDVDRHFQFTNKINNSPWNSITNIDLKNSGFNYTNISLHHSFGIFLIENQAKYGSIQVAKISDLHQLVPLPKRDRETSFFSKKNKCFSFGEIYYFPFEDRNHGISIWKTCHNICPLVTHLWDSITLSCFPNYDRDEKVIELAIADQTEASNESEPHNKIIRNWQLNDYNCPYSFEYSLYSQGIWSPIVTLFTSPENYEIPEYEIHTNNHGNPVICWILAPKYQEDYYKIQLISYSDNTWSSIVNLIRFKEGEIDSLQLGRNHYDELLITWIVRQEEKYTHYAAYKPQDSDWVLTPLPRVPGNNISRIVENDSAGNLVTVWANETEGNNHRIYGSVFSSKNRAWSLPIQLSPEENSCLSPSLVLTKPGHGYIAWCVKNGIQIAEISYEE